MSDDAGIEAERAEDERLFELPPLQSPGEPYRTPRSGQGFRTTVFGEDVEVEPRNRRSVSAWDLGFMTTIPGADETEVLPYGSLYFWRHPDDDTLFRAVVAVLYNEVFYAKSTPETPFEAVFTFENYNVPMDQSELVDGKKLDQEELVYGYVRPGIGGGWRTQTAPGEQDNMAAFSLIFMPGFHYFGEAHDAADDFTIPQDGFDLRVHGHARWDALVRNLLDLPHDGFVLGGDGYYGYRPNWEDWGYGSTDPREPGVLRWHLGLSDMRLQVVDELPPTIQVCVGEHVLRVVPMAEIERVDPWVHRLMTRWRKRSDPHP